MCEIESEVKPIRIQRKRTKGSKQESPNGLPIKYVGRGSRWGNPFRVIQYDFNKRWGVKTDGGEKCTEILISTCQFDYATKEEAVKGAIKCYIELMNPYKKGSDMYDFLISSANMDAIESELAGMNLSCWCKEDENCHADWLLFIANGFTSN